MPNLVLGILLLGTCLAVVIAYCIWKTSSTNRSKKVASHKVTASKGQALQTNAAMAENDLRILRESRA